MRTTRTKIVATLGPASEGPDMVRRLIAAGVDVFRLNFSHGDHQSHARHIRCIREAAEEMDAPVAVLQDLQGPRIRTGRLKEHKPVTLQQGDEVTLRAGDFAGDAAAVCVNYEHFAEDITAGDRVMVGDGVVELEVLSTEGDEVRCRIVSGGELREHEGMNLPGVALSISSPTEKDIADLEFGLDQGVDFVALSFVQSADDVHRLKEAMRRHSGSDATVPVIPKIEKPEALENLRAILTASEGVMVARGDLGIEMRTEEVPVAQKKIIATANRLGIPAITATQMLESMVERPRPSRAEASDVANAILDGTDALMLSGETSIGNYPVASVRVMDSIARETEEHMRRAGVWAAPEVEEVAHRQQHALANAACMIAERLGVAGIVPFTLTGSTARYISQRRPTAPIYALTPADATRRRLTLLWGVQPVMLDVFDSTDQMVEQGRARLTEMGLVSSGDTVVYVAGASTRTPGGTDMLKIQRFEPE